MMYLSTLDLNVERCLSHEWFVKAGSSVREYLSIQNADIMGVSGNLVENENYAQSRWTLYYISTVKYLYLLNHNKGT